MTNFSHAVKIGSLSDFIAPSESCVIQTEGSESKNITTNSKAGEVLIQNRDVGDMERNEAVKISLHDCLACSGCVTTAETVLLQQQSVHEFNDRLADPSVQVVVSISLQSISSLALKFSVSPIAMCHKLSGIFRRKGAKAVFALETATQMALLENALEFKARIENNGPFPMLASSCPGWICFAEKSHGELLPNISSVKSPQGIMGTLIKRYWAQNCNSRLAIYHVTVMPCYDKKLEAVREDLSFNGIPDVDCVLSSDEVSSWLDELGSNVEDEPCAGLDRLTSTSSVPFLASLLTSNGDLGHLYNLRRNTDIFLGSDGYLEYIYRSLALDCDPQLARSPLDLKPGRNLDYRECKLTLNSGLNLNFSLAYGFRNIQGLVRKIKQNKCTQHYIEVMACPSGCVNGGGQTHNNSRFPNLGDRYDHNTRNHLILSGNLWYGACVDDIGWIYENWICSPPGSPEAKRVLHTNYKERKRINSPEW